MDGERSVTQAVRVATNTFFRALHCEYSGALPCLDPRTFTARICWTSAPSIADIVCTSRHWRLQQHWSSWPCTCSVFAPSWPRVRCPITGVQHVCARQEEIPWPTNLAWLASWSCRTRIRPSAAFVRKRVESAFLAFAVDRSLADNEIIRTAARSGADSVASAAAADWRLADLCVTLPHDVAAVHNAAAFVRDLWVEVRDHATHRFQAVCPALALSAIHKVWEFGSGATGEHFVYGTPSCFGYRDIDDLLGAVRSPPNLSPELQPVRLAKRRRGTWELGCCRTLPKHAAPAGSHRPLCNREKYPTSELDSIMCQAGVRGLASARRIRAHRH